MERNVYPHPNSGARRSNTGNALFECRVHTEFDTQALPDISYQLLCFETLLSYLATTVTMLAVSYAVCQREDCGEWAVGEDVFCGTCDTIFCRGHYDHEQHYCRYTNNEVSCIERGWSLNPS